MPNVQPPRRATISPLFTLALLVLGTAYQVYAAEQTVLGNALIGKNPSTPAKRMIVAVAKEKKSPNTIVGDPTAGGAMLTIAVSGGTPSSETYNLPAGTSATTGKRFWGGDATKGFKYNDAKGENGPLKTAQMKLKKGVF